MLFHYDEYFQKTNKPTTKTRTNINQPDSITTTKSNINQVLIKNNTNSDKHINQVLLNNKKTRTNVT